MLGIFSFLTGLLLGGSLLCGSFDYAGLEICCDSGAFEVLGLLLAVLGRFDYYSSLSSSKQ
jgi:hypothetical protein